MRRFEGQCHCKNIKLTFRTKKSPQELPVRVCQCTYCTKHAAHYTTDKDGEVEVTFEAPENTTRYQFGLKVTEFLICSTCGVSIGAITDDGHVKKMVLNINVLEEKAVFSGEPVFVNFDKETPDKRKSRHLENWTPVKGL